MAGAETYLVNINFQLKQTGSAFNRFYVMEKLFKFCFYFDFIVMAGFGLSVATVDVVWIVKITPICGGQFPGSHAGLWPRALSGVV